MNYDTWLSTNPADSLPEAVEQAEQIIEERALRHLLDDIGNLVPPNPTGSRLTAILQAIQHLERARQILMDPEGDGAFLEMEVPEDCPEQLAEDAAFDRAQEAMTRMDRRYRDHPEKRELAD